MSDKHSSSKKAAVLNSTQQGRGMSDRTRKKVVAALNELWGSTRGGSDDQRVER